MAHEFNNVLQIISANADLMATEGIDGFSDSLELQEIRAATERAANMINQLLCFSRRGIFRRERVEMRATVLGALSRIERTMPFNVLLETCAPDSGEAAVLLDPGALEQMLESLCSNARDAMPGGGSILVECAPILLDAGAEASELHVHPGSFICVTVSDNGSGMEPAILERIFEPFFTTKPVGQGTGLGLPMVYGVVKDHGGAVHVQSEAGKGTVVRLYFPVAKRLSAEPRSPQPVDPPQLSPQAAAR